MTGQDKGDLLIQVTTWAGLTVTDKHTSILTTHWIFFQNEHYIIFECTNIFDMLKLELSFFVPYLCYFQFWGEGGICSQQTLL